MTLTLVSSEALARNPKIQVTQEGFPAWIASAKHVAGRKYRVSVTLQAGGPAGAVEFTVIGIDSLGGRQSSAVSYPLQ